MGLANLSNLNGRILVVHQEINAIKQGFLVAHNNSIAWNGSSSSSIT